MNNLGQYPFKQSEKMFEILFIKDLMRLLSIYHYEALHKTQQHITITLPRNMKWPVDIILIKTMSAKINKKRFLLRENELINHLKLTT